MAWQAIDRKEAVIDPQAAPVLNEAVREKIRSFLPRFETKRAALLPALHVVQDELGHVGYQAMKEVAEVLDIHPSEVLDTASFYTHFWTHPKGRKVIMVCRGLTCEIMGGAAVLEELKSRLGINEHETTPDGKYSLVTEEGLARCDHAPCLLINEKLHRCVKPEDVARILADADNDRITVERSDLFDAPVERPHTTAEKATGGRESEAGSTSDAGEPGKGD